MDGVMHSDLIRRARQLAAGTEGNDRDRSVQIELRDAIRCAYYALFHLLSKQCADFFAGTAPDVRSNSAWLQAYRSLQHGVIKSRCINSHYIVKFPSEIRLFAEIFVQMQWTRHLADYDPMATFDRDEVITAVEHATSAIVAFEAVSEKHRRAFAVYVASPLHRQAPQ